MEAQALGGDHGAARHGPANLDSPGALPIIDRTVALLSRGARDRAGRWPAALPGRWAFRLLLAGALAVGVGYLPYRAYGPEGVPRTLRLRRDLEGLEARNRILQEENRRLRQRVRSLREDRQAVERVARDELGLVRSEDLVFQFE